MVSDTFSGTVVPQRRPFANFTLRARDAMAFLHDGFNVVANKCVDPPSTVGRAVLWPKVKAGYAHPDDRRDFPEVGPRTSDEVAEFFHYADLQCAN